jgi:MFS family permease
MVEQSTEDAPDMEKQANVPTDATEPGSSDLQTPDEPKVPYSKARLISLVLTVTGAAFLNVRILHPPIGIDSNHQQTLSVQAVVIILPDIGKDLSIPASRQQWIVSAYSLTFGCFLLFWGRIADVMGKRLIFLVGSAWLAIVTVAVPFVKDEITFDALRGLQGIVSCRRVTRCWSPKGRVAEKKSHTNLTPPQGAAANVPTAIGVIGVTIPPGKAKAYAFTCYGGGAPLGAVFGNILV